MAQIVTNKAIANRCNLQAIQGDGSKANIVLAEDDVWLVDTTNSIKVGGFGRYDSYIIGDGVSTASELTVLKIDDEIDEESLQDFVSVKYKTDSGQLVIEGELDDLWMHGDLLKKCTVASTATSPATYVTIEANECKIYAYDNVLYRYSLSTDSFVQIGEQGPQGEKGDTGDTGPQGLQGIQGNTGISVGDNWEAFSTLEALEGKTDSQKQAMLPDAKTVDELCAVDGEQDKKMLERNTVVGSLVTLLAGVTSYTSGARLDTDSGTLKTNSNGKYMSVPLDVAGIEAGDIIKVEAMQTSTSVGSLEFAFFQTATDPETGSPVDVAVGDSYMSDSFVYYNQSKNSYYELKGFLTVPEGATHFVFSLYNSNDRSVLCSLVDFKGTDISKQIYGAYILDQTTFYHYNKAARTYLIGSTGMGSNTYGSSGVYYAIAEYIDVSDITRLAYTLRNANAVSMALIAAYDKNKNYILDNSVVATNKVVSGIWTKGPETKYIRLTVYWNNGNNGCYVYNPDLLKFQFEDFKTVTNNQFNTILNSKDYFENSLTDYSPTYKRYIVASTGLNSDSYGSGNRFRASGYIDASGISDLVYNICFYCKANVAVIAAYDVNHTYIADNSVIFELHSSASRKVGTWTKGSNTAYIRLCMDTNYGSQYVINDNGLPSIKSRIEALEEESKQASSVKYNPEIYTILQQMRERGDTANPSSAPKTYTGTSVFIHFSDIHGCNGNMESIVNFYDYYANYIDDVINTGDSVANSYPNSTAQSVNGAGQFLTAIGNHDTATYSSGSYNWKAHAGVDAYNKYIEPYIKTSEIDPETQETVVTDVWQVTQPIGDWSEGVPASGDTSTAEEHGYCFYYKDYDSGVRLIVLDYMNQIVDQDNWLEETLKDAAANSKTVVIASHYVDGTVQAFPCGMTQNQTTSGSSAIYGDAHCAIWENLVDSFLDGTLTGQSTAGKFACWISGHSHVDNVGYLVNHPRQVVVRVAMAAWDNTQKSVSRYNGGPGFDDFNIICIDPTNNYLQLAKVGSKYNRALMERKPVCINYSTQTIVWGGF